MRAALVLLVLLGSFGEPQAAEPSLTRFNLKGLTGVYVSVEGFGEAAQRAGLSESTIQTDVELKLRMAGIKVMTLEEWDATRFQPTGGYFFVNITATHTRPGESAAFNVAIELREDVRLVRNGALVQLAATWSSAAVGYGDIPHVRNSAKDLVDRFINAWLSVNPK